MGPIFLYSANPERAHHHITTPPLLLTCSLWSRWTDSLTEVNNSDWQYHVINCRHYDKETQSLWEPTGEREEEKRRGGGDMSERERCWEGFYLGKSWDLSFTVTLFISLTSINSSVQKKATQHNCSEVNADKQGRVLTF